MRTAAPRNTGATNNAEKNRRSPFKCMKNMITKANFIAESRSRLEILAPA